MDCAPLRKCAVEVLLACRWHLFGGNNIDARLSNAFDSFDIWRRAMKLNTSLTKFELATFKMTSLLGVQRSCMDQRIACEFVCGSCLYVQLSGSQTFRNAHGKAMTPRWFPSGSSTL